MSAVTRLYNNKLFQNAEKLTVHFVRNTSTQNQEDQFRVLNLKNVKTQIAPRKKFKKPDVAEPRNKQMAVDQDWGSVWPGPRTFHPASVPLPVRQGFVEKGAPPHKYGNAELMKIPNFLHLTPPVIKRQCEALRKFCTPWPHNLKNDAKCAEHFPLEVAYSSYCHSSPTIRDPLARIVNIKVPLSRLPLDAHAKDKFRRLVGDKYNENTDTVTIVTDRCPTNKQNYDYAMYLLTAIFHESWRVESWEATKSEADMECYAWTSSVSRKTLETMFGQAYTDISQCDLYSKAVDSLMNEGESEYTVTNYGEAVRKVLQLPTNVS